MEDMGYVCGICLQYGAIRSVFTMGDNGRQPIDIDFPTVSKGNFTFQIAIVKEGNYGSLLRRLWPNKPAFPCKMYAPPVRSHE